MSQPPPKPTKKTYFNSGILSRNKRQQENPELPPYSGQINVKCPHCDTVTDFWLNADIKEGQYGKFFGIRLKPKQASTAKPAPPKPKLPTPPAPTPPAVSDPDDTDDLF